MTPKQQELFDALPASGTITYRELHTQLTQSGRGALLREFHVMRRKGMIWTSTPTAELVELDVAREAPNA